MLSVYQIQIWQIVQPYFPTDLVSKYLTTTYSFILLLGFIPSWIYQTSRLCFCISSLKAISKWFPKPSWQLSERSFSCDSPFKFTIFLNFKTELAFRSFIERTTSSTRQTPFSRQPQLTRNAANMRTIVNYLNVLGSIPASYHTVESEGRQMKQCWIQNIKYPRNIFSSLLSLLWCRCVSSVVPKYS
jgi:hypothetical protein